MTGGTVQNLIIPSCKVNSSYFWVAPCTMVQVDIWTRRWPMPNSTNGCSLGGAAKRDLHWEDHRFRRHLKSRCIKNAVKCSFPTRLKPCVDSTGKCLPVNLLKPDSSMKEFMHVDCVSYSELHSHDSSNHQRNYSQLTLDPNSTLFFRNGPSS